MDPFLGDIVLFSFDFVPVYWMACEGQTLQISTNQALFTLLGTSFGGDGISNFKLPDMRNSVPIVGMHYCISLQGIYPNRN